MPDKKPETVCFPLCRFQTEYTTKKDCYWCAHPSAYTPDICPYIKEFLDGAES
jgi:hypothetical protein